MSIIYPRSLIRKIRVKQVSLSYLTSKVENLSASFYTNSDSIVSEKLGLNLWIKMK